MATAVSVLAVIVACLGVFGLASFAAERRTREIGIRKTLGASEGSIVALFSREFAALVIVANAAAWPLGYRMGVDWLANRIEPEAWMFALSGLVAMVVALGTVGLKTLQAARVDPVKALRDE